MYINHIFNKMKKKAFYLSAFLKMYSSIQYEQAIALSQRKNI
jgi:hypothetical protein